MIVDLGMTASEFESLDGPAIDRVITLPGETIDVALNEPFPSFLWSARVGRRIDWQQFVFEYPPSALCKEVALQVGHYCPCATTCGADARGATRNALFFI